MAAYRRDIRRFFEWLQGRGIPGLSIRDLADYAGWLHGQELGPASIARHIVSLRVFFRYLQLEGALQENLAELLGSQKLWERVPKVLGPQQIERLLQCPHDGDPYWRRDRAMLELLYATGCRASELSGLRLADLHLDEGYCICRGKGDKQRLVPIGGRAIAAVRVYLQHERGELAALVSPPPDWVLLSSSRAPSAAGADLGIVETLCPSGRRAPGDQSPHATAQFCHPHAQRRGRSSPGPGNARSRQHRHHADIHPRRCRAAEGGA